MKRKLLALITLLVLAFSLFMGAPAEMYGGVVADEYMAMTDEYIVEYGYDYYTTEEVALYLHAFVELPPNFITKDEAYDLGWNARQGNLWDVGYGLCIGGDVFGNREGLLPETRDRIYYECDVNYEGGFRESERIVFSNDGLIYYTGDHYESFELLYDGFYYEDALYEPWGYEEDYGW